MAEARLARLPGARPSGSDRNGMPPLGGYKYRKHADWSPEAGRHLNEDEVMPRGAGPHADPLTQGRLARAAMQKAERQARIVELARLMESGLSAREAAGAMGIAEGTARDYVREMRTWGGEP